MSEPDIEIEINGVKFTPRTDCKYPYDYVTACKRVLAGTHPEIQMYREIILEDLWFILYFVMKIPTANHPFVVEACWEVMTGPKTQTLDLWAREHFKSSIFTVAEVIQRILRNPEERICIFSYTGAAATSFLHQVKQILETSDILKACFPDVLYQDPRTEAEKWSLDAGLYVKRKGVYKEATLEAWGLIEGMPTGKHFSGRVYDDIMTEKVLNSPDQMELCKQRFDFSENLGTFDGWVRVIGTTYHHEDPLCYIQNKKTADGTPVFVTRIKPATVDGTPNGASVFLPEERLAKLRAGDRQMFFSQQLLDPTPQGEQKLDKAHLKLILPQDIPSRLYKFIVIDPAGERNSDSRQGDSWAIYCIGVEPYRDDLGASNIYVLDLVCEPLGETEALNAIVQMYLRNGRIVKVGVEKVAMNTTEIHVASALRAKRINLSIEAGTLVLLRPGGRKKAWRIVSNLKWPLDNGKVHISSAVSAAAQERLKMEMDKFPFWHDDALDGLSYVYDLIKEYRFPVKDIAPEKKELSLWDRIGRDEGRNSEGWMIQ